MTRSAHSTSRLRTFLLGTTLAALGCASPIGVDRMDPRDVQREITSSVLTNGELSQSTDLVLQRLGLAERFEREPQVVIREMREGLIDAPDRPDRAFALAELCFHHALEGRDPAYFLCSTVLSYAYLFPEDPNQRAGPLDPRRRIAADLYNQGLAGALHVQDSDTLDLAGRELSYPFGAVRVEIDESSLVWKPYRLVSFVPSVEYEVRGMRNRYRTPGLGASLIAGLTPLAEGEIARGHRLPPNLRVPVTVLLFPEGDVFDGVEQGALTATLKVYVQNRSSDVQVGDLSVPLEYDTSAALAYSLEGSPVWDFELAGFRIGDLNPLAQAAPDGLFLLAPYKRGRVPVVLVHGTASSPGRWAELINELMGDDTLNERIQIWLFIYPTGNPILLSGANLRDGLRTSVAELDPEGVDEALKNMVVIGHSQGGLLTKLQAVDSGNSFWANVSDTPFEEANLTDHTRELLQRALFFDPLPFVRRVVFMATPHGGSYLAAFSLSSLASGLVTLPLDIVQTGVELVDRNESRSAARQMARVPTSIDNMRPGNPFLTTLHAKPLADWIIGHSIIGVPDPGPPEVQDDGVVEYESAHLEGMASEVLVPSGHSLQAHPDSINEVRRILREHLDAMDD